MAKGHGLSVSSIVMMIVSFFVMSIIAPIAIGTVANANTNGWNASVVTIFQTLLPVVWVIGVAIIYVSKR